MVAAILRAMWPDLPMPLTMTLPLQARMRFSALRKSSSMRCTSALTASASMERTWRAKSSAWGNAELGLFMPRIIQCLLRAQFNRVWHHRGMNSALHLILILLAVAVGVVVLFRILKLPVMLGYLLVGIMIGPHAMGWIPDAPETRHLAEFGVVFLMFSIGLEFSLARLRAMQRLVFGLGTAQVVATMLLVMLSSLFFELDWRAGLALGGILAMSSTAIVSKMLVERAELSTPHGQKIMGVLLFQDLAVVPLIIIIPSLAEHGAEMGSAIALAMLKAGILLTALLTFGQRLLRPWFHVVAGQKSSELFM